MDWSQYLYLAGIAVAALALLVVAARLVPGLAQPREGRRRTRAELVALGLVLVLGIAAIYWNCLLGGSRFGYWDVGSDTLEEYVPYYIDMVNAIKAGTWGAWDFTYGLGTTFMAYDVWAFDPFNVITVPLALLLGTARLGRILALVQGVKILLAGYLFDHLLTFYCRAPLSRVLGGSLFGFGGWLLLWGQHYWLGAVYVGATLLVLLVELLMERWSVPRFLGVMATTAVSILMGVYSGFMVLLFAAIYAVIRSVYVSRCRSLGQFLRFFGRLALPVVCGILAAGVMIVPYAYLILNETSRVTDANGLGTGQRIANYLTGFVPLRWLPIMASRILGNGLLYTGDVFSNDLEGTPDTLTYLMNSYEFLMVGTGGATLVLGSQCLGFACSGSDRRRRVLVLVTCALMVLFCVNEFLPALFSAFDLKYRASFALVFPLCIGCAVGWERVVSYHELRRPSFVVSSVVTFAIILWSLVHTTNGRLVCLFYLVATVAFVALLAVAGSSRAPLRGRHAARQPQGRGWAPLLALACAAAIAMPVVDGFFSTNARGISGVDGFPGATDADADTQAALSYLRENDTEFYRIGKTYSDWTTLNDSLVQGYSSVASYNSLTDSDVIEFYRKEWPEALPTISAYQVYAIDPYEISVSRLLGIRYILTKEPVDLEWLDLVGQFGSVYVYEDVLAPTIGSSSILYQSESDNAQASVEDRRSMLGSEVVVPDDVASTLQLQPLSEDAFGAESRPAFHLTGSSHLEGTMDVLGDSVACLSIPYTTGWTVSVDGQQVETFRADYGFVGFVLPAGTHQVTASYTPTGLTAGIGVSLVGIALGFASCVIGRRRRDRGAR